MSSAVASGRRSPRLQEDDCAVRVLHIGILHNQSCTRSTPTTLCQLFQPGHVGVRAMAGAAPHQLSERARLVHALCFGMPRYSIGAMCKHNNGGLLDEATVDL